MRYLDIYKKLANVRLSEKEELTFSQRIRLTFKIANCSPSIVEEIIKYLDTQEQPEYSLTLKFKDKKTNLFKTTVVTCQDIEEKMLLQPLPALLYMDWLRREPEQASAFIIRKDNLKVPSRDVLRAHTDPAIIALAEKEREAQEVQDRIKLENGK